MNESSALARISIRQSNACGAAGFCREGAVDFVIVPGLLETGLGVHDVLVSILAFSGREDAIKNLSAIFNAWLLVISSLLSAAATYYFSREKR